MAKANLLAPVSFFRSVIEEAKHVIWPSRQTILKHTVMVVVSVAIAVVIFASLDYGLSKLVILALNAQ